MMQQFRFQQRRRHSPFQVVQRSFKCQQRAHRRREETATLKPIRHCAQRHQRAHPPAVRRLISPVAIEFVGNEKEALKKFKASVAGWAGQLAFP
jgi:hypothetical protein